MSIFIDPTGESTFGLGICARCSRKLPLDDLYDDPNAPGLKVCIDDLDEYDPYRLAARPTEEINLLYVRPDRPLVIPEAALGPIIPEGSSWLEGSWLEGSWLEGSWLGIE